MSHRRISSFLTGAVALLLSTSATPPPAAAQEAGSALESARVRVTELGRSRPVIGTVLRLERDTLYVARDRPTLSIPLASVARLEVSRGKSTRTWRGVLIGTLVGVGTGILLAYPEDNTGLSRGERLGAAAVGVGVLGALVGAGIGALSHKDRWETLPLEQLKRDPGAAAR